MVLEPMISSWFHLKKDESQQSLYRALYSLSTTTNDSVFHFRLGQSAFRYDKCMWTSRWLRLSLVTLTCASSVIHCREGTSETGPLTFWRHCWTAFSHDGESWKFSGTRKMIPTPPADLQLWNRFRVSLAEQGLGASDPAEPEPRWSTRRKLQVIVLSDSLLQGTEAPVCRPDLLSQEVCCLPGPQIQDVVDC